jgi:predicted nucleic acid-binding protein
MSEEELEDESEPELSEEDSLDDGTLSPDALAASDLLHRKKDEKRLELDLSKHQQLLIDSQKLNESLKRCLGWTEELINEGKKALEYNVKASDIELGGRVLISDDVEDGLPVHTTLNPIDIDTKMLQEAMSLAADETNVWRGERKDDRDSGIVLDGSQREPFSLEPPPKSRP